MTTILVVDDELSILETLRDVLEWEHYTVVTARSGKEGLAAAAHHQPALVLLDFMMPHMNGLEMLSRMRETPGLDATPVIMMTAAPARLSSVELRWDALLVKPFDADDLLETISALTTDQTHS